MEEKKVTKFSLTTFLLIIAILVIIIMGVFIFKLYNDNTNEVNKSTELQSQVNSLNVTISDLQGKINNISETKENTTTSSEAQKNEVVKEENNTPSNELTNKEITQNIYTNNTGDFSITFSYITLAIEYSNAESEIEVTVNENKANDSVGTVKLGVSSLSGADKNVIYTNLEEKIVDVLFDVDKYGHISTITLLTSNGNAYTTPWNYRYDSTQAKLFKMGENVVKLSFDSQGGCGYDKDGNIVFHTNDIYIDGE